jgi:hypothetical protein
MKEEICQAFMDGKVMHHENGNRQRRNKVKSVVNVTFLFAVWYVSDDC